MKDVSIASGEDASAGRWSRALLAIASFAAGALALMFLDLGTLERALNRVRLGWLAIASVAVIASYVAGAVGLSRLTRRPWSERLGERPVFHVTVISQIAANLFSLGGLTGASVRARMLAGREAHWAEGIVVAVIFSLALNASSVAISVTGLVLSFLDPGPYGALLAVTLPILISAVFLLGVLSQRLFIRTLTERLIRAVAARYQGSGGLAARVDALLERALDDSSGLVQSTSLVLSDWALMSVALGFCFQAVGSELGITTLVACFGAGAFATLISFVPGGVGVLETSMVGVAVLHGVELESATLAVLFYRALYYGLPIPLSLLRRF